MIALGCDHGGYALKEELIKYLETKHIDYKDFGTYSKESVNYAAYAEKVASAILSRQADRGILICSTGLGICMAANKIKGIRAAACTNVFTAEMTRRHNDANVLCMGAMVVEKDSAIEIVEKFLDTGFDGGRHKIRIDEIAQLENGRVHENLFIMDHPLIQHKLTFMRDEATGTKHFRELVSEIATLMCYEATRDLPLESTKIRTPMTDTVTKVISGRKLAFVPILRAGLGMVDGMLQLVPSAKVGHIGLYRDHKTLKPVEYYNKLPQDINMREVIVLDPMLATGGSAVDAISIVKKSNPKCIKFLCIIAAPEGIKILHEIHPDVEIYCAAVDERLNEYGYIIPGLGDAGDRIFGTK